MNDKSKHGEELRAPQSRSPDTGSPAPARKKRVNWIVVSLASVVAISFVTHNGDGARELTVPSPAKFIASVAVTTARATKGNIGVYLDAIGTVTPVYTSSITPQANGIVTAVNYTEGQVVKKGDSLIEIDPRPYQAQLAEAQGTLDHDTNVLAQAQMDVERYLAAWARNAIQKQTLDDQEKLVLQQQGTVKFDQGAVDYAAVQLGYCHITAPIAGRVGLRLLDPGNVVQASQASSTTVPLVVITQIQPITVIFTIAEDSIGQVQAQMHGGDALPLRRSIARSRTSSPPAGC